VATRPAGYSGTPLAKKLGIGEAMRVFAKNAPDDYETWLAPLPPGVVISSRLAEDTGLVHLFHRDRMALAADLARLRGELAPGVPVWVSWPKKAAKVPADVTEDAVREVALPLGFVDIKVCAVSEVWSGLKLVVRKALR
jgi:hypothetical protein